MIGDGLGRCCFDMSSEVVDQVLEDRLIEVDTTSGDNDSEQSCKYLELKDHGIGLPVVPYESPVLGIIGIEAEAGHDLPDLVSPLSAKWRMEVHQILIADDMKGVIHLDLCVHLFGGTIFRKAILYILSKSLYPEKKSGWIKTFLDLQRRTEGSRESSGNYYKK